MLWLELSVKDSPPHVDIFKPTIQPSLYRLVVIEHGIIAIIAIIVVIAIIVIIAIIVVIWALLPEGCFF